MLNCLKLPNGEDGSETSPRLIPTIPAWSRSVSLSDHFRVLIDLTHQLVLVTSCDDRCHGPEDLLLQGLGVEGYAGKDGRRVEVAGQRIVQRCLGRDVRTTGYRLLQQLINTVDRTLVDERTDLRAAVERRAGLQRRNTCPELFEEGVGDVGVAEESVGGCACLAELRNFATIVPSTATVTSAPGPTMSGALPPSSIDTTV
jgi:hypothetical protein